MDRVRSDNRVRERATDTGGLNRALDTRVDGKVTFISRHYGDRYRLLKIVAEGGFGFIFSAERERDGERRTIKVPKQFGVLYCQNEFKVLCDLSTPACRNVIQCWDKVVLARNIKVGGLLQDLCHISLEALWETRWMRHMTSNIMRVMMGQMWTGLAHIHRRGYAHQDLATRCILIDANTGTVKLCDLGMADKEVEYFLKRDVIGLARILSNLASNPKGTNIMRRMENCASALGLDSHYKRHPGDAAEIYEVLPYIFETSLYHFPKDLMLRNPRWWDELVDDTEHKQTVAVKAIEWIHSHPEVPDGIVLDPLTSRTFVSALGFQGYDAINADKMARDFKDIINDEMKEECTVYFQKFLHQ